GAGHGLLLAPGELGLDGGVAHQRITLAAYEGARHRGAVAHVEPGAAQGLGAVVDVDDIGRVEDHRPARRDAKTDRGRYRGVLHRESREPDASDSHGEAMVEDVARGEGVRPHLIPRDLRSPDRTRRTLFEAPRMIGMRVGDADGVRIYGFDVPEPVLTGIDHDAAPAVADQKRAVPKVALAARLDVAAGTEEGELHPQSSEKSSGETSSRASSSISMTWASLVWSKCRYHVPMATSRSGTARQTSSSTSCAISSAAPGAHTGTATTTFSAPARRAASIAARVVAPVARPSSTRMQVRPRRLGNSSPPRYSRMRRSTSLRVLETASSTSSSARPRWSIRSSSSRRMPGGATAPIASSGCIGAPTLPATMTSSGAPSDRETSKATSTPPLGSPTIVTSSPR